MRPNDKISALPRVKANDGIRFRNPTREDGQKVNDLIAAAGVLDENSLYCNFLQCTHFSTTCMIAELDGEVVGWVSGYRPPEHPDTLFVWQVAVSQAARGKGLARRLIHELLQSEGCEGVDHIKTTITPDNTASWRTFEGLAAQLRAPLKDQLWLCGEEHFGGEHDSEHMLTIGPFEGRSERRDEGIRAEAAA